MAPGAFYVIWKTFRDDFFTTVCRITDPKESGPKKNPNQNLTLEQLRHVIEQHGYDTVFLKTLTRKLTEIGSHCTSIRDTRNKTIGHLDMATILEPNSNPLPNVNWEDVRKALELLAEFMNVISVNYTGGHIDFVPNVTGPARNIVYALREFKRLQNLEYEQQQAELREEVARNAIRSTHDPAQ